MLLRKPLRDICAVAIPFSFTQPTLSGNSS
jgi:hypothetical protein